MQPTSGYYLVNQVYLQPNNLQPPRFPVWLLPCKLGVFTTIDKKVYQHLLWLLPCKLGVFTTGYGMTSDEALWLLPCKLGVFTTDDGATVPLYQWLLPCKLGVFTTAIKRSREAVAWLLPCKLGVFTTDQFPLLYKNDLLVVSGFIDFPNGNASTCFCLTSDFNPKPDVSLIMFLLI